MTGVIDHRIAALFGDENKLQESAAIHITTGKWEEYSSVTAANDIFLFKTHHVLLNYFFLVYQNNAKHREDILALLPCLKILDGKVILLSYKEGFKKVARCSYVYRKNYIFSPLSIEPLSCEPKYEITLPLY